MGLRAVTTVDRSNNVTASHIHHSERSVMVGVPFADHDSRLS